VISALFGLTVQLVHAASARHRHVATSQSEGRELHPHISRQIRQKKCLSVCLSVCEIR
jgi:hypothetical protein